MGANEAGKRDVPALSQLQSRAISIVATLDVSNVSCGTVVHMLILSSSVGTLLWLSVSTISVGSWVKSICSRAWLQCARR
ncbi:hypothetical protein D3C84_930520 [compost metagenome]